MTTDQLTAVRGMDCVCYLAKDLSRARGFYEGVLGMIPATRGDTWVEYEFSDGSTFALSKLPDGDWYQTGGAMFAVHDLHAALERVRGIGANVTAKRSRRRSARWCGAAILKAIASLCTNASTHEHESQRHRCDLFFGERRSTRGGNFTRRCSTSRRRPGKTSTAPNGFSTMAARSASARFPARHTSRRERVLFAVPDVEALTPRVTELGGKLTGDLRDLAPCRSSGASTPTATCSYCINARTSLRERSPALRQEARG